MNKLSVSHAGNCSNYLVFCSHNRNFASEMAGIYIHIPFCSSRCIYCGFYSTTALEQRQRYVDAVVKELEERKSQGESEDECIGTVYLGGGTPSQLTPSQLQQLFDAIHHTYKVETDAEITMECNPDDITVEYAAALSQLPVNRVSMGAQTFSDERLRFLRRRHTSSQVTQAVDTLRTAGIGNVSVDLMYGFPGETLNDWTDDIEAALALDAEHLSAYCLTIEEGTPLYQMFASDTAPICEEELERQMYEALIDKLTAAGYEHYEISNFAKPGYRSRHNSSYWNGTPYLGIGAAAHSYNLKSRRWNVADIIKYMEGIEQGHPRFEEEKIDNDTRYNDTVTVALRTCEGIDLKALSPKHRDYCLRNARRFLDDHLLEHAGDYLRLTRRGLFVSDMVMSELIWI